jgi:hypothetical protein
MARQREHLLTGLIARITGSAKPKAARFYVLGRAVMISTESFDGQWCDIEPHHTTEEARSLAERKAEQTAAALREYLAAHPD